MCRHESLGSGNVGSPVGASSAKASKRASYLHPVVHILGRFLDIRLFTFGYKAISTACRSTALQLSRRQESQALIGFAYLLGVCSCAHFAAFFEAGSCKVAVFSTDLSPKFLRKWSWRSVCGWRSGLIGRYQRGWIRDGVIMKLGSVISA